MRVYIGEMIAIFVSVILALLDMFFEYIVLKITKFPKMVKGRRAK